VKARLALAPALAAALLAPPALGEPGDSGPKPLIVVEEEARTEFVPDSGAAFAVTTAPAPGKKLVACVVRLSVDGRQLPANRLAVEIEPGGAAGPATLVLRDVAPARPAPPPPPPPSPPVRTAAKRSAPSAPPVCPSPPAQRSPLLEQGAYLATVRVAQDDGSRRTDIRLSFDKKPASVKADATLAVTRVVTLFDWQSVTGVSIQETSGRSPLHLLDGAPSTKVASASGPLDVILAPSAGTAPGRVILPSQVAGFDVTVRGNTWPGKAVGLLALRAPELAGGVVMLPVEVTTRLSYFWLGLLLFAGVALGIYMRDVLENRRKLDAARARAYAALRPLEQLLPQLSDRGDSVLLTDARRTLQAALDAKGRTPETIDAAVEVFKTAFKEAVEKMAERRAKAEEALTKWSVALSVRGLPGTLQARIDELAGQLQDALAELHARAPAKAEKLGSSLPSTFENAVIPAALEWRTTMRSAKDTLPPWPEVQNTEDPLQKLAAALDAVGADAADGTPEGHSKFLRQVADAAQTARDELSRRRGPEILRYAAGLLDEADKVESEAEPAARRTAARKALHGLAAAVPATVEGDVDGREYMKAERALFDALVAFFEAASGKQHDSEIDGGKFRAVLETLPKAAGEGQLLGRSNDGGGPAGGATLTWLDGAAAPGTAAPQPRIRLQVPLFARVGQPVSLAIVSPDGAEVIAANVRWTAGPLRWTGDSRASFTPAEAGQWTVRATLAGPGGEVSAAATMDVLPIWDADAEARFFESSRRILNQQTVFAALLTVFIGLVLLAPGFVGTFDQLFLAFAWGFAADIGLDKFVELAKTKSASAETAIGTR
jgi:hypothetical protein